MCKVKFFTWLSQLDMTSVAGNFIIFKFFFNTMKLYASTKHEFDEYEIAIIYIFLFLAHV